LIVFTAGGIESTPESSAARLASTTLTAAAAVVAAAAASSSSAAAAENNTVATDAVRLLEPLPRTPTPPPLAEAEQPTAAAAPSSLLFKPNVKTAGADTVRIGTLAAGGWSTTTAPFGG